MQDARLALRATGLALLAVLASAPAAIAEDGTDSDCPPRLVAWRTYGGAEAGAEWSAQLLEIRGDVAILRELSIRFDDGALPPEEARWFDAPAVLEPIGFFTRTLSFTGRELHPFCRSLSGPRFDAMREESRPLCFVRGDGAHVRMQHKVNITNSDARGSGRAGDGSLGMTMDEGTDPDDVPCLSEEEFAARAAEIAAKRDQADHGESDDVVMSSITDVIDRMARRDAPFETGLVALPPARQVLEMLRRHDESRIPERLPSEFYLTASASSAPYAEALALERMLTAEGSDEEVALKLLGDGASPSAAPLLRLKLRSATAANRTSIVGLALRALLATDPHFARLEAVPLLADPAFARSALGVFALTDPATREELDAIDTADQEAVAQAALRLLEHLEAATGDDELGEAARRAQKSSSSTIR